MLVVMIHLFVCCLDSKSSRAQKKKSKNNVLAPLYQNEQRILILISDQHFSFRRVQKPTSLQRLQKYYHFLSQQLNTHPPRKKIHMTGLFLQSLILVTIKQKDEPHKAFLLIPNVYYVLKKIQYCRRKTSSKCVLNISCAY